VRSWIQPRGITQCALIAIWLRVENEEPLPSLFSITKTKRPIKDPAFKGHIETWQFFIVAGTNSTEIMDPKLTASD
jgi:hypothetical protein